MTAICRKILWGFIERRQSKISRRQLSEPPTPGFEKAGTVVTILHNAMNGNGDM